VSQNNGVQLAMLALYNQIPENSLVKKGDLIRLKPGAVIIKQPTVLAAVKTHQVQPKEGLYTISKKYNVSVEELKQWNNLSGNDLQMGQQLIIAK